MFFLFFFFQAEDGIRDRSPSRGLGDVYKRQCLLLCRRGKGCVLFLQVGQQVAEDPVFIAGRHDGLERDIHLGLLHQVQHCLLYTSDAADEEDSVDLGGRRIIKKKNKDKKKNNTKKKKKKEDNTQGEGTENKKTTHISTNTGN